MNKLNLEIIINKLKEKCFVIDGASWYHCDECIELDDVIKILNEYVEKEN